MSSPPAPAPVVTEVAVATIATVTGLGLYGLSWLVSVAIYERQDH